MDDSSLYDLPPSRRYCSCPSSINTMSVLSDEDCVDFLFESFSVLRQRQWEDESQHVKLFNRWSSTLACKEAMLALGEFGQFLKSERTLASGSNLLLASTIPVTCQEVGAADAAAERITGKRLFPPNEFETWLKDGFDQYRTKVFSGLRQLFIVHALGSSQDQGIDFIEMDTKPESDTSGEAKMPSSPSECRSSSPGTDQLTELITECNGALGG